MAIIVPILRLFMIFLNIYDSFKTLKYPRPSARNRGQPSVRALSQRKRDLKGCLAVWAVWCVVALYENIAERIVCLFIPFYSEFKALLLLFLIFTRARGAEPIYLHVIRPFLRPYTPTLDALLEAVCMFGDTFFAITGSPIRLIQDWWFGKRHIPPQQMSHSRGAESAEARILFSRTSNHAFQQNFLGSQLPPVGSTSTSAIYDQDRAPLPTRLVSGQPPFAFGIPESIGKTLVHNNAMPPQSRAYPYPVSQPQPPHLYSTWKPPPSSYDDDCVEGLRENPTILQYSKDVNVVGESVSIEVNQQVREEEERFYQQMDEWRRYPDFPSAYPATPVARPSRLEPLHPSGQTQFASIEEEVQQDFDQSLLPGREPSNPSSVTSLSDSKIHTGGSTTDSEGDMYVDSDEEDEFNVTLRTPMPLGALSSRLRRGRRKRSSISQTIISSRVARRKRNSVSVDETPTAVGQKRPHSLTASETESTTSEMSSYSAVPLQQVTSTASSSTFESQDDKSDMSTGESVLDDNAAVDRPHGSKKRKIRKITRTTTSKHSSLGTTAANSAPLKRGAAVGKTRGISTRSSTRTLNAGRDLGHVVVGANSDTDQAGKSGFRPVRRAASQRKV